MKPMLAAATDGTQINFPVWASPKLDGVRCLIIDGIACSRSLKPIPNQHVQRRLGLAALNGLDGELIVGSPTASDVYNRTVGGVMAVSGEPHVRFHVFDDFMAAGSFRERLAGVARRLHFCQAPLAAVPHHPLKHEDELLRYEEDALTAGYEGIMLRHPDGPYKHGRSTLKEGWLLKLKRFTDAEAEVLGVLPLRSNTNEAKRNALGQLERSSHQAGMVAKPLVGSLLVRDLKTGVEFEIGTGFNQLQREQLWATRESLIGKLVKYKSQPTGVKTRPRFPVFLGLRDPRDL